MSWWSSRSEHWVRTGVILAAVMVVLAAIPVAVLVTDSPEQPEVSSRPSPTDSGTVQATSPPGQTPTLRFPDGSPVTTYLVELEGIRAYSPYTRETRQVNGVDYPYALTDWMGGCSASEAEEWLLPIGAQSFTAVVGLADDSLASQAQASFKVFLDGRPAFSQTLGLNAAAKVYVDVRSGRRLKLDTILTKGNVFGTCRADAVAVWGDPAITKSEP